jgi:hypothetical protein
MTTCQYAAQRGVAVRPVRYGNALIEAARNQALKELSPEADYALFVDDDMVTDADALMRLLEHQVPVVSALCTTRPPVDLPFKVYEPRADQFVPLAELKPDSLVRGQFAVGAAFLLVERSVLERLREFYLTAGDWLYFERRTLDRLHVRTELREAERARREGIRRAGFARDGYLRVFDRNLTPDDRRLGEDMDLSRKLVGLGIETAIDTATVVAHVGDYPYGPWDLDDKWAGLVPWARPKSRGPLAPGEGLPGGGPAGCSAPTVVPPREDLAERLAFEVVPFPSGGFDRGPDGSGDAAGERLDPAGRNVHGASRAGRVD